MQNWLLQNLSDVLNRELEAEQSTSQGNAFHVGINKETGQRSYSEKTRSGLKAQREWRAAIASVEILLSEIEGDKASTVKQGLIFSAPVPLLSHPDIGYKFQSAVFTTDAFNVNALMPCRQSVSESTPKQNVESVVRLPLIPNDSIEREQFCLILTANFGLIMVLGEDIEGNAKFHFSFDPLVLNEAWTILRSRLVIANHRHLVQLDELVEQFAPPNPNYRLVTRFNRQLLQHLPNLDLVTSPSRQVETIPTTSESVQSIANGNHVEMELLQALTHEVRTPLTTIRTLTKLLLKRKQDFKPNVVQRLQTIDRECTEQIERMELIFRAAELESTSSKPVELVPFPLEQVFQQNIPRWQEKAKRRNVDLNFTLPPQLPKVVSDPAMLDTVLTGLMESCTRSLPTGGHIEVKVSTAGNQLKLQVLSQASNSDNPFKSLGQLLTFQPATGCLGLNLDATKNIFQALGGKLTVRQRQEQGKELTIFLPLGNSYQASNA